MTTHLHLILDVDDGVLPRGMHALNWNYAMHFNQRYSMRGHSQFARYGARRVIDDDDLLGVFKYVMRNPVEAALCASPSDWRWSSYAETIGLAPANSFVDSSTIVELFTGARELAIAQLRAFVENP
jgi:putative transposase